jgi:hypothetical protein
MALPTYTTGTASVAAGGTVVTGVGCMWTGINAKQGDFISIGGSDAVLITEVTDTTHLKVTPWPDAAKTTQPYIIYQSYVGRVVGVAAAEDVGVMLEKLHVDGLPFIVGASETVPDPSYGDEGQLAFQPTTGLWWVKTGGAWQVSAGLSALGYGGTSTSLITIGTGSKVFTTQTGLAYNGARVRAASAANQNNFVIGPATYSGTTLTIEVDQTGGSGTFTDWLFSVAGSIGPAGPVGPVGPIGPTGASGTGAGNVVGPTSAIADHVAVYNGTTGTIIKDGGKTIAELAGAAKITTTSTPPVGATDGDMWFEDDTGLLFVYYDDGSSAQWVMTGGGVPATPRPARGQLGGLTLSTAGSSATFSVAAGEAADSSNAYLMVLSSALSKTTSAWSVGSAAGALDAGAIAINTWYHVYLIKRTDTDTVDVLISLSATTPALPASYTLFRRIGAIRTDGASQWTKFVQRGDEFVLDTPVQDISVSAQPASSVDYVLPSAPLGISVQVILHVYMTNAAVASLLVREKALADVAPGPTIVATVINPVSNIPITAANVRVWTNTTQTVTARASAASTTLRLMVVGWVDRRGKDD